MKSKSQLLINTVCDKCNELLNHKINMNKANIEIRTESCPNCMDEAINVINRLLNCPDLNVDELDSISIKGITYARQWLKKNSNPEKENESMQETAIVNSSNGIITIDYETGVVLKIELNEGGQLPDIVRFNLNPYKHQRNLKDSYDILNLDFWYHQGDSIEYCKALKPIQVIDNHIRYIVIDSKFNRANYPDIIGKIYDSYHVPSDADVIKLIPEKESKLSDGSIEKIYKWSGVLALIIEKLRSMQTIYLKIEHEGSEYGYWNRNEVMNKWNEEIKSIGFDLAELIYTNWDLCNDMSFFKDIYNRSKTKE